MHNQNCPPYISKPSFWIITLSIIFLIGYYTIDTITPFLVAYILAYLLHPIVKIIASKINIEHKHSYVVIVVFTVFCILLIVVLSILVPLTYQQIKLFTKNFPLYKSYIQNYINSSQIIKTLNNDLNNSINIQDFIETIINSWLSVIMNIINHLWQYTVNTINTIITIIMIPILLFYFLRDWPNISQKFSSILPKNNRLYIHKIFLDIQKVISAYIRGQLNICLLVALYLSVSLSFIGLDFALLIGIISGFAIIIPFIGYIISIILALTLCMLQFGISQHLIYVTLIFLISHVFESYILTPNLIGNKIGLHPLWIFFSVLVCGKLLGFKGIFFAIPIAGVIQVLIKHLIQFYKKSIYYNT